MCLTITNKNPTKKLSKMVEASLVGNQEPASWPRHPLGDLERVVNAAKTAGKYLFVWDQQGSVGTFMQYKGKLACLGPEVLGVSLGRKTPADVAEFIRQAWIAGQRNGENLCYDCESTTPDFAAYKVDGTFDADIFFDHERMNVRDNFMQYVREGENHGIGGLNDYDRSNAFGMIIRSGAANEDDVKACIEKIPLFGSQFQHVIFE